MEERIVDKDDPKVIKLKRTQEGETDAVDPLAEGEEEEAVEEVLFDVPEGEDYDEDLVGLTPSQLQRELERRKKAEEEARAECEKLVETAQEALEKQDFEKAAPFFSQAACYSFADERILKGLWAARTRDFTNYEPFYVAEYAGEFSASDGGTKAFVRERAGERLRSDRAALEQEEAAIAPGVLAKQEERRGAFGDNRRYYFIRLVSVLLALVVAGVATGVSAYFIVRTVSVAPVVLTAVFGAATLCMLVAVFVFARKHLVARRLCSANEELSSTEEGARLKELRDKLSCLKLILEDGEEE